MAVVFVGALNVSSISTQWMGEIKSRRTKTWDANEVNAQRYERGDEIGKFNLGSTVILIMNPNNLVWCSRLNQGQQINMAEKIGTVVTNPINKKKYV